MNAMDVTFSFDGETWTTCGRQAFDRMAEIEEFDPWIDLSDDKSKFVIRLRDIAKIVAVDTTSFVQDGLQKTFMGLPIIYERH